MKAIVAFIRRIRASSLAVRRRWLVVFTVPTMVLVVLLWAAYMRASIGGGAPEPALTEKQDRVGAFAAVAAGWDIVATRVENGAARVARFLRAGAGLSRSIEIEAPPPPTDFALDGLEEIPPTALP